MDSEPGKNSNFVAQAEYLRRRYLGPFLLFLQILRIAITATWFAFLVPYTMDISFPEGAVVARAYDVACGEIPYSDWREWPHNFSPYGPLTYFPVGWMGRMLNIHHPLGIYPLGRIQSLFALVGICILLGTILRRFSLSPVWIVIGVSLFFVWEAPLTFVSSYRPDAPQVFFALFALWLMLGGEATPLRIAGALLSLSLAMWFKPTAWGILATSTWWIWTSGNRRRFLISFSIFAAANLGLALFLNWKWDGKLFLNMIDSLNNGWKPGNLILFYQHMPAIPRLILVGGVIYAVHSLRSRGLANWQKLLFFSVLASFISASAQNLKVGADVNYYVECYALAAAMVAIWIERLWEHRFALQPRWQEITLCAMVIPLAVVDSVQCLTNAREDLVNIRKAWKPTEIADIARETDGPILVTHPFLALQRPAPPTLLDYVQYNILVKRGKLREQPLLDRLNQKEFEAVLVSTEEVAKNGGGQFTSEMKAALWVNYHVDQVAGELSIFRPNDGNLPVTVSPPEVRTPPGDR